VLVGAVDQALVHLGKNEDYLVLFRVGNGLVVDDCLVEL
jgi:hypothetical protein